MSLRGPLRASPSLLAILLLLLAAFPAPTTADGPPGCGLENIPCEIDEGSHEGTLQPYVNDRDYYSFTPPEDPAAIQITVHADAEIEVILRDPEGRVRGAEDSFPSDPIHVGAVAQPAGKWIFEISYRFPTYYPSLQQDPYTFTMDWVLYDHVERIDMLPGVAPTSSFNITREAHVEVIHQPGTETEDPTVFRSIVRVRTADYSSGHGYTYGSHGLITHDPVQLWASPPAEMTVGLGVAVGPVDSYPMDYHHPDAIPATVDMAYSTSKGIESSTAWVAYNGEAPVIQQREGHAFYHRATDMEGGQGVFAGGAIDVQELWIQEHVPSSSAHSTSIVVNARDPWSAQQPTVANVTKPNGETVEVSDETLHFHPDESGTWRVDYEHIDGQEGSQLRFHGWSFPLTPWPDH